MKSVQNSKRVSRAGFVSYHITRVRDGKMRMYVLHLNPHEAIDRQAVAAKLRRIRSEL